jgi:hypothetical protein
MTNCAVRSGRSVTAAQPQPTQFIAINSAVPQPSSGDPRKPDPMAPATLKYSARFDRTVSPGLSDAHCHD